MSEIQTTTSNETTVFTRSNRKIEMSVGSILQLIKSRELGFRSEQRPFKYDKVQFDGIVSSVLNGYMYAPIVLCDINSCLLRALHEGNQKDINYFTSLLNGKTQLKTAEDGQHRLNYFVMSKSVLESEVYDELLLCNIPVVIQEFYTLEDITLAFNYTNSGNKIKNQDLVWSNVTWFNAQIKDLTEDLGLRHHSKKRDAMLKIRDSYKLVLKSLKVLAHMEDFTGIGGQTGDKSLISFVKQNFDINQFNGILDCWRTTMVGVNQGTLLDSREDFAKYNLLFTIHVLKVNNIQQSLEDIINTVNEFPRDDYFGSRNSSVVKRYKLVRDRILEIYGEQQS